MTDVAKAGAAPEAKKGDVRGATEIKEFIGLLRRPRAVMMLVPARSGGFGHHGFVAALG